MCATLKDKGESILLRTYEEPEDAKPVTIRHAISGGDDDENFLDSMKIVDAARATSAAPVYLPEKDWKTPAGDIIKFWDGGVLNNNPVTQLWDARYDLVKPGELPPAVSCVLSVGCSWSDPVKQPFLLKIFRVLNRFSESFMANTEAKHHDFQRHIKRISHRGEQPDDVVYRRLNAPTKATHFDMADPKIMPKLEALTENYLSHDQDAIGVVEEIAQLLASRD